MATHKIQRLIASLTISAIAASIGCEKTGTPSTTQPAAAAQRVNKSEPAVLIIGGEPIEFAVTRLEIVRDQASMQLRLQGQDRPRQPLSSFDFDITLDGDDPELLVGKMWRMDASPEEDVSSTVGISLSKGAIRLQPKSVRVEFSGEYPNLTVDLSGTFLRDADEQKPVKVSGTFAVVAHEKPTP